MPHEVQFVDAYTADAFLVLSDLRAFLYPENHPAGYDAQNLYNALHLADRSVAEMGRFMNQQAQWRMSVRQEVWTRPPRVHPYTEAVAALNHALFRAGVLAVTHLNSRDPPIPRVPANNPILVALYDRLTAILSAFIHAVTTGG